MSPASPRTGLSRTLSSRPRSLLAGSLVAAVVATAVVGCSGGGSSDRSGADRAARSFLAAWSAGDYAKAGGLTDDRTAATTALRSARTDLTATKLATDPGSASVSGDRADLAFTAHWTLTGLAAPWTYRNVLHLQKSGSTWRVHWAPAVLHPQLRAAQRLGVSRTLPERAAIQDDRGRALFSKVDVVTVGVEPKLVRDLTGLARTLARRLHVSSADIVRSVRAARPTEFVPVITLRQPDYAKVRSAIHDLPGTVFQTGTRLLAPTAQFAKLLLGGVGPATADALKALGPGYLASDQLGTSGLQATYNRRLAGTAGLTITATATKADRGAAEPGGTADARHAVTLARIAPQPGQPLRTTLDVDTQRAADAALSTVDKQAAIVAVRPSTGAILAVANSPSASFNLATQGRYPAGSTFKIVTTAALLERHRVSARATVPCPGQTTVYGKVFHNEDSFDLGQVPLQTAFAHSCNTSFTGLSKKMADSDLPTAASQFGIGAGWDLPGGAFSGSVPAPRDDAERAADTIGQGRVEVSPLAMALTAATVAHGTVPAPSLIAGQPAKARHQPDSPPASVLRSLRPFMRAVVTDGTARGLADAPGGPVLGKTGTAEYGTATPPRSHAWFAGYQGDLAFAVFIAGGESSSTTAVPVTARFLAALHR